MKVYIQSGKDEIETTIKILEKAKPNIKDKVLIKPNLTLPSHPESNICTSPKVIEGLIRYLRNYGIKDIIIGDGAGGVKDMSEIFKVTGYRELSKKMQVPLVDLNQDKAIELKVNNSYFLKKIQIAKTAVDGYVINVPKMKTHRLATVTLALKNMMGVIIPYNKKLSLHPKYNEINERRKSENRTIFSKKEFKIAKQDFFKGLADFYSVFKPGLNIIDGVTGKDGDGLIHGKNIRMDCILLSDNILAIDYVAAYLMGFNLSNLYLKYVKNNKINNLNDIHVICNENLESLIKKFKPLLLTEHVAE